MKRIQVYTLFLLSVACTACGQNKTNPPHENLNRHRSGVPESQLKDAAASKVPMSMVRNVKQARNGDILIASYIGVYRYNGESFTNVTRTIEWPTFWDVLEDRKGNLWLASQDSGVYLQPAGQNGFKLFKPSDGTGITSALHIYEDRAGNIWFGANRWDGKSLRTFTTDDGFPTNHIRLLLEDKTGKLWFGAQGEDMFVYDGQGKTLPTGQAGFTVLKNKDGNAFNNVWSVIEDKKGNIWFGADGLWRYEPSASLGTGPSASHGAGTFTKVSERGAYAIIQDKEGNIWTTGGVNQNVWALSRYDAKSLYSEKPDVTEIMSGPPAFLALMEAADGSIWFGGLGAQSGVYRYDGKTVTDFKSKDGQK